MTETEILRILFPPEGAIPLDRIDILPQIRSHISTIIALATGSREESLAITLKIVELREAGAGSWTEIAKLMGLGMTGAACRHRYTKYVKAHPVVEYQENAHEATEQAQVHHLYTAGPSPGYEAIEVKNHPAQAEQKNEVTAEGAEHPPKSETDSLQEAEPTQIETASEVEKKSEEVPTIRKSLIVECGEQPTQEKKPTEVKKSVPLDPDTLTEVDRLLGEGLKVHEISDILARGQGKLVPWTKIRARAAYLARMKKVTSAESEEEEPQDRPEPVSISRKELDLHIWDLWKAGKTLDEISDILYSEGLYYSPDTVKRRLIQQGAKL